MCRWFELPSELGMIETDEMTLSVTDNDIIDVDISLDNSCTIAFLVF